MLFANRELSPNKKRLDNYRDVFCFGRFSLPTEEIFLPSDLKNFFGRQATCTSRYLINDLPAGRSYWARTALAVKRVCQPDAKNSARSRLTLASALSLLGRARTSGVCDGRGTARIPRRRGCGRRRTGKSWRHTRSTSVPALKMRTSRTDAPSFPFFLSPSY